MFNSMQDCNSTFTILRGFFCFQSHDLEKGIVKVLSFFLSPSIFENMIIRNHASMDK